MTYYKYGEAVVPVTRAHLPQSHLLLSSYHNNILHTTVLPLPKLLKMRPISSASSSQTSKLLVPSRGAGAAIPFSLKALFSWVWISGFEIFLLPLLHHILIANETCFSKSLAIPHILLGLLSHLSLRVLMPECLNIPLCMHPFPTLYHAINTTLQVLRVRLVTHDKAEISLPSLVNNLAVLGVESRGEKCCNISMDGRARERSRDPGMDASAYFYLLACCGYVP